MVVFLACEPDVPNDLSFYLTDCGSIHHARSPLFVYFAVASTPALGAALLALSSTATDTRGPPGGNKDLEAGARQGSWDPFCGIVPALPGCQSTQEVTLAKDQESQAADGVDKREEALQARQIDDPRLEELLKYLDDNELDIYAFLESLDDFLGIPSISDLKSRNTQ
ncbi:hypothetical protein V5O48_012357 [Marasmius crinis-equi]|uniref:Uncharacterized protein n=1 Tax=Marasmius crinis-equi TaxID=585013 RepID=A0ABR3F304_9AGAR